MQDNSISFYKELLAFYDLFKYNNTYCIFFAKNIIDFIIFNIEKLVSNYTQSIKITIIFFFSI